MAMSSLSQMSVVPPLVKQELQSLFGESLRYWRKWQRRVVHGCSHGEAARSDDNKNKGEQAHVVTTAAAADAAAMLDPGRCGLLTFGGWGFEGEAIIAISSRSSASVTPPLLKRELRSLFGEFLLYWRK